MLKNELSEKLRKNLSLKYLFKQKKNWHYSLHLMEYRWFKIKSNSLDRHARDCKLRFDFRYDNRFTLNFKWNISTWGYGKYTWRSDFYFSHANTAYEILFYIFLIQIISFQSLYNKLLLQFFILKLSVLFVFLLFRENRFTWFYNFHVQRIFRQTYKKGGLVRFKKLTLLLRPKDFWKEYLVRQIPEANFCLCLTRRNHLAKCVPISSSLSI